MDVKYTKKTIVVILKSYILYHSSYIKKLFLYALVQYIQKIC